MHSINLLFSSGHSINHVFVDLSLGVKPLHMEKHKKDIISPQVQYTLCFIPGFISPHVSIISLPSSLLAKLRNGFFWLRWVLTGRGHDPCKAGMAKRLDPSNFTPRGKSMEKPGVVSEAVRKPMELRSRVRQPPQAMATERHWDAESTDSNMEECEHCEQLKRDMPPLDTKRASVTTVKRTKRSDHHDTRYFTPKSKIPGHRFTHAPSDPEQQWEAESFESNTGDSALKPSLHCKAKQILKHLVSSSVMSTTPPRRLANRRGTADVTRKAGIKLQVQNERRKNAGPFYNFSSSDRKSKAG